MRRISDVAGKKGCDRKYGGMRGIEKRDDSYISRYLYIYIYNILLALYAESKCLAIALGRDMEVFRQLRQKLFFNTLETGSAETVLLT